MIFILATLSGFLRLKKQRPGGRDLYGLARKENLDFLAAEASWETVRIAPRMEAAYFELLGFDPDAYPGEGYLQAVSAGLSTGASDSVVLGRFLTHDGTRIVDTRPDLTERETTSLLESLSAAVGGFSFCLDQGRAILTFRDRSIAVDPAFPGRVRGTTLSRVFETLGADAMLVRFLTACMPVLDEHPVNRIRSDMGQNVANFLWLWGPGSKRPRCSLRQTFAMEPWYYSSSSACRGLAKFCGFEMLDRWPSAVPDGTFLWAHLPIPHEHSESVLVRRLEAMDAEIISGIRSTFSRGGCRVLVLLDSFEDAETESDRTLASFFCTGTAAFRRFGTRSFRARRAGSLVRSCMRP